jgi:excisionase family DNA binding protein
MSEEFVTLKEAQALLGVSNFTVWRMVKDGRLTAYPSQVDRRKKLVRRSAVEALLRPKLDAKKARPLAA